jgi:hypothetical protein
VCAMRFATNGCGTRHARARTAKDLNLNGPQRGRARGVDAGRGAAGDMRHMRHVCGTWVHMQDVCRQPEPFRAWRWLRLQLFRQLGGSIRPHRERARGETAVAAMVPACRSRGRLL